MAAAITPYAIVQFDGPLSEAQAAQAAQLGIEFLGYIPEHAYVAKLTPETTARLRQFGGVRWIGPYLPDYKVAPALGGGQTIASATPTVIEIIGFPGESAAALASTVGVAGATVILATDTPIGPLVRATVAADAIAQLAAIDGVAWVEPFREARLADIEARKILNADALWQSSNLFGAGQIVAISDSGLSVQGQLSGDFGTRLIRAYPPSEMLPESTTCRAKNNWTDLNGHGTHVAGSVLGSGTASGSAPPAHQYAASNAGVAPEAQMIFMAMNTDGQGAIQCIPPNGNYIAYGYQNGARISSNSWGSNSAGVYTYNASVIDDYIWRNRDYLVLFAAGNEGPGARTVGSPGSAKNIISVGASENNRPAFGRRADGSNFSDNPDEMAFFSSRGPTADGRVKPDIVAPGTNILSVLGAQARGLEAWEPGQPYALSSGTSMATPLTAGSAALVRQWLMTQRNVAAPSAALLKALLIHGAFRLPDSATPNMNSGFGRVDLKNTIGARYAIFEDNQQGLQNGNALSFNVDVVGSSAKGTLYSIAHPATPADLATIGLSSAPTTASAPIGATGVFTAEAVVGYGTPYAAPRIAAGGPDRASRTPSRGIGLPTRAAARPMTTTPPTPSIQDFQQQMIGGGNFEDPDWSQIWQQIWIGEGLPVRTDGSDGGIVLAGQASVWLDGTASDDLIAYPVSFPEQIDNAMPSRLRFLLQQTARDPGFDQFCVAIADASGQVIGTGDDALISCGDDLPSGQQQFSIAFTAAEKQLLAGKSGYLMLYTEGDGELPHMSTYVDNVELVVDFPPVTVSAAPNQGPPGTRFLIKGSNNVPYGQVDVCASSCGTPANTLTSVYADARGDLLAYVTASDTATPGTRTIETRNVAGRRAQTQITIGSAAQATLSIAPPSGPAGTEFRAQGSGYLPNASIAVALNDTAIGTTGSDDRGAISFTLTTASNTAPGAYGVRASDASGHNATASFTVVGGAPDAATLSVSPATGTPGTQFRFTGSGFGQGAISFTLDGQAVGQSSADAGGRFAIDLTTSSTIAPGNYTLTASQGERRATASFTIDGGDGGDGGGGGGGGGGAPSGNGLYVTLVWTDPPGQASAALALVNNLDLTVTGPGGVRYGNGGTGTDTINNVETVQIERPEPGSYTITVRAARVSGTFGAQPFVLLATTAQTYGASPSDTGIEQKRVYMPFMVR